jgi:hypothetical protein
MNKLFLLLGVLLLIIPATAYGECIEGDCANGYGIYIFPEGGQFSGEFAEGEFAAGKQVFADGNRYEGTFINSTPHGEGVLTYADGSVYRGQFDMGVITGKGSITFTNNSKYEGDFVNGVFHGKGIYTYSDGNRYDGEFNKGQMEGKGTLHSDGREYIGEFKEGKPYGKGSITYFDKSREIGEWKDGKFVVSQTIRAPVGKKSEDKASDEQKDFVFEDAWTPPAQSEAFGNIDLTSPSQQEAGQN